MQDLGLVLDRVAWKSSATADERMFIDDGCTDADDGCTDTADGGTFPRRPVRNELQTGKESDVAERILNEVNLAFHSNKFGILLK